MKQSFFQIECKSFERIEDGVKFKGFASTPDIDRGMDVVDPTAFQKSLDEYILNPVLLRSHNPDRPVGNIMVKGEDAPVLSTQGLFVNGLVTEKETGEQVMAGELRTMSIGFIPLKVDFEMKRTGKYTDDGQELELEARIIRELDLVEISIVSTPANPKALFTVEKSIKDYFSKFPSPTMKHKCSVYKELPAVGRIGDRWFSQKAIDEMEFKSNEEIADMVFSSESDADAYAVDHLDQGTSYTVTPKNDGYSIEIDEEKVETEEVKSEEEPEEEEPKEESETTETSDETAEAVAEVEETSDEGGEEKHILSVEQKGRITKLREVLEVLDKSTTVEDEDEEEEKSTNMLDLVLPILMKFAEQVIEQRKQLTDMRSVLDKVPVQKGKTITAMQYEKAEKASPKKDSKALLSSLKQAKDSGQSISL